MVTIIVFTIFISATINAGARGFAGVSSSGGDVSPWQPTHGVGQQLAPADTSRAYGGGSGTFYPDGPGAPHASGMQQVPGPARYYGAGGAAITPSIPIPPPATGTQSTVPAYGGNMGVTEYQNAPSGTAGVVNKLTPEKVEAGSENIRRVSQSQPPGVTGGQYTYPSQPVRQPYEPSLLRGNNNNNQKGGRYLGQYP